MNRKWIAIVTLLVLMLSVCVLAAAEEPTDPVYPVPGPLEKHEHTISIKIVDRGYTAHRLNEWCPDCGRLLKERLEKHNFVDGVCTVCDWECPHPPEAAEKHYERDGVKPQWDGNYIIGPGWEITECGVCHTELSRVETTVREFHNVHTHFTPVLECLPHDADTHALIRYCDECGTEVPEYVPHNCPPSDRPYTDEGDPDTHSRLVRCADCGFWVPQQQAHTWVHDSYTEFDGSGDYHNEVLHCSVCGAVKQVPRLHEWKQTSCVSDGDVKTHTCSYECTVCGDCKEVAELHTLEHYDYKYDGDTNSHIEVLECTECGQIIEGERFAHKPTHLYWKSVTDTQDQETVICNLCGLTYQQTPTAHQFDAKNYETNGYEWRTNTGYHTVYQVCSKCGARNPKASAITEKHTFMNKCCTKCNQAEGHDGDHEYTLTNPSNWVMINEKQHAPKVFCEKLDSKYRKSCFAKFINYRMAENHTFDPITMKCTVCGYLKEGCEHQYTYKPGRNGITEEQHTLIGTCTRCGKQITVTGSHDMQFVSATEYVSNGDHRGDQVSEAPLSQEGLTEDSGDETVVTPVFCHLAADGNEMPFGYELILSDEGTLENGDALRFTILPESISGDSVIEARFTASEIGLLQAFGVKSVYIRLNDINLLLLSDIAQVSSALVEQEADELVITLTLSSVGTYATQYDPAGVYITE